MNQGTGERGLSLSRATIALGVVIALVLALSAVGWWALSRPPGSPFSDFEASAESVGVLIRSWGAWGVAGSIGLMVIHSFVPFPAEILAIANGMVYGPLWGTVVTWVGAMLGAFLAFGLARRLGRPFIKAVVPAPKWQAVDAWSRRHGGGTLLISRLVPLIAFNLINYAAGLTAIGWFTFAWATGVGILPLTVLMAYAGATMTSLPWWSWPVLAALALAAWLVWRRWRPAGGF